MSYENIKFSSIGDVINILNDNEEKLRCIVGCGEPLSVDNLMGYPDYVHDGGIQILGEKYWLYLHCDNPTCEYDTALHKLRIKGLE